MAARTPSGKRLLIGAAATAAVVVASAPQATNPPAKMHTRAVPRSRIVARSAVYSTCSRAVSGVPFCALMTRPALPITEETDSQPPAHCGTGVGKGLSHEGSVVAGR